MKILIVCLQEALSVFFADVSDKPSMREVRSRLKVFHISFPGNEWQLNHLDR